MAEYRTIGGKEFRDMLAASCNWLKKSADDINNLNVFPVPDGDTGTNMSMTYKSGTEEALAVDSDNIYLVAKAMAHGALLGARGNSGVILSQFWNGFAKSLENKEYMNSCDYADALTVASAKAYSGIANPVEGTMLTVMRDAASGAQKAAEEMSDSYQDIIKVAATAVDYARDSVSNTPNLLKVLREAGVVDSGGQGIYTILEAILLFLRGEEDIMQYRKSRVIASTAPSGSIISLEKTLSKEDEDPFGYCTEFLVRGEDMDVDKIRKKLEKKGESLIVVGDETTVRIHIHTLNPGEILEYACSLGTMHNIGIHNMDEQSQRFEAKKKDDILQNVNIAVIAVCAGKGLNEVFTSLGAVKVIEGGQTMNPSTKDFIDAINKIQSQNIIILPNNKNIIMAAEQVKSLTDKNIFVVPTRTIPQGIAALLAFDYNAQVEENTKLMTEATKNVKTVEITRASRSTNINGLDIKKKQAIGLIDGNLLAVSDNASGVMADVLNQINIDDYEVATLYYGEDITAEQSEITAEEIRAAHNNIEVEVIFGGQPHYDYIVAVE
ncbi:MAG: DAK2 domain-containing protein [Chloroflexi bacterium]|nr:DAK2 domain-containing protein [Chloroflexota bacterium]